MCATDDEFRLEARELLGKINVTTRMSGFPMPRIRRLRDAADAPDLSGTKYEIVGRVGQGGMGPCTARVIASGPGVALKVVRLPEARRILPPADAA